MLTRSLDASRKALGTSTLKCTATIQLAELYGLQGRTAKAEALFAKAGATKSADLKEFPIFFGTNRKRDTEKRRIAFGNERNLDELTLVWSRSWCRRRAQPTAGRGGTGKAQVAETRISDTRQL